MYQRLKVWSLRRFYRALSTLSWRRHPPGGRAPQELTLDTGAASLRGRLYPSATGAEKPLVLYFHGGGWVLGDLQTHDPFCRALRRDSGCSVLAVEYRLAPEHPFPAALDDAVAASRWVAAHLHQLEAPHNARLLLAGDSAGGNLACCACLEADSPTRAVIDGAIVFYPVTDHYRAMPASYQVHGKGHPLTASLMIWFWDTYLDGLAPDAPAAQRAMPGRSPQLRRMPPTFLITAEFDPLRDEGLALAEDLERAGVAVTHRHFERAAHGFACSEGPTADFRQMMADLCRWIEQRAAVEL